MKKIFTIVVLAAMTLTAYAQQKKVAVYVDGDKGAKVLAQTVHTADKAKDITTLVRYVRDFIINSKPENKTFGEKKSKKSKKKKTLRQEPFSFFVCS